MFGTYKIQMKKLSESMKTRLEQALDHYLNGREIAVWGNPTRSLLRALKSYKYHIADVVDL
jgi:aminocyclitol acetyltransferase